VLIPLAALRMPAAVLLERRLAYRRLAASDMTDGVVFYAVAATAAWTGAGVWSFVLGAVAGRLAALALLAREVRWAPRERRRRGALGSVLRFGLLYQGTGLVTMIRDAAGPVLVGASSGVVGVGLLNWAAALAFLPLQVVSIGGRVLFPALSRLQENPREFAELTGRTLDRIATLLYPCAFLLFAGASPLVELVYGEAWRPAIPALRLFCISAVLGGTSSVLVHALHGAGRADVVFRLNVVWTVLLWGLTLVLVPRLGFVGFAVASAIVGASGILTGLALSRLMPVRILPHLRLPLAASLGSALLLGVLAQAWIRDLPTLVAGTAGSILVYVGLLCAAGGRSWRAGVMADWRAVWAARP
jgi:PST family polysaccharide transporter